MGRQPSKTRPPATTGDAAEKLANPAAIRRLHAWPFVVAGSFLALVIVGWALSKVAHRTQDPEAIWSEAQQSFRARRYDQAAQGLDQLGQLRHADAARPVPAGRARGPSRTIG